jgi:hypothetical protein
MAEPMSLSETREHLALYAEHQLAEGNLAVKAKKMDVAARCADRMECARDEGLLLIGDDECRNPLWRDQHARLQYSAQHHGLIRYDIKEPTE